MVQIFNKIAVLDSVNFIPLSLLFIPHIKFSPSIAIFDL